MKRWKDEKMKRWKEKKRWKERKERKNLIFLIIYFKIQHESQVIQKTMKLNKWTKSINLSQIKSNQLKH